MEGILAGHKSSITYSLHHLLSEGSLHEYEGVFGNEGLCSRLNQNNGGMKVSTTFERQAEMLFYYSAEETVWDMFVRWSAFECRRFVPINPPERKPFGKLRTGVQTIFSKFAQSH